MIMLIFQSVTQEQGELGFFFQILQTGVKPMTSQVACLDALTLSYRRLMEARPLT